MLKDENAHCLDSQEDYKMLNIDLELSCVTVVYLEKELMHHATFKQIIIVQVENFESASL